MLMNVMLIKKTYNYSLIPVLCDNKKKEELEVTIFDENQVFCKKKSNFWRVLSQRDIIECISFFVDK